MIGTLVWLLVAVMMWPFLYRFLYITNKDYWDDTDRIFAIVWGGFVCLCWPIFLPIFLIVVSVRWLVKRGGKFGLLKRLER